MFEKHGFGPLGPSPWAPMGVTLFNKNCQRCGEQERTIDGNECCSSLVKVFLNDFQEEDECEQSFGKGVRRGKKRKRKEKKSYFQAQVPSADKQKKRKKKEKERFSGHCCPPPSLSDRPAASKCFLQLSKTPH